LEPHNAFAYKYRAQYFFSLEKMEAGCADLEIAKKLGYTKLYDREVLNLTMKNCVAVNRKPAKK